MLDVAAIDLSADARDQQVVNRSVGRLVYAGCILTTLFVAVITTGTNGVFSLAMLMMLFGLAVAIVRPIVGLYLFVVFAMFGDNLITPWYPFNKNLSSWESILFLSSKTVASPLELFLVATTLGWVLTMWSRGDWTVRRGRLLRPLLVFTAFVFVGLVYGLARGGAPNIALWEVRTLLYIPVIYLLVTNLLRRREQLEGLFWGVMVGVLLSAVFAFSKYQGMSSAEREGLRTLVTHSATLPMNAMFLMIASAWLFRNGSWAKRLILPIMAIPVAVVYLVSERRAAMVALGAGFVLMGISLFWTRRRLFWRLVPVVVLLFSGYLAAFWNGTGAPAAPAQAVKTVVAPDQLSEEDQSSDIYRDVENANLVYTIKGSNYLGVGFGNPFDRPFFLPEIAPYLLQDYMPHNTILWLWLKVGLAGFVALAYLMGQTMRRGAAAILASANTPSGAITMTSVGYVIGYVVFAYVDIAWDPQSIVLLGLAIAQLDMVASGLLDEVGEIEPEPVESIEADDDWLVDELPLAQR